MGFRQKLSQAGKVLVAELQQASSSPETRSVDHFTSKKSGETVERNEKRDKHYPDTKKLERYWELYKNVSIIRNPIRSFASEVVAPGYYVDAENDDLKEELEDWLKYSAIVDGETDKDFTILLKKAQVQREVKGTALVEKVSDTDGELYGFKLMRPSTVRAYTKPGQTVLLPPDYDIEKHKNSKGPISSLLNDQDFYTTEDGDVAAYVQVDETFGSQSNDYYIAFSKEDIIKLTRDTDVGDVFGESRLASVEDRLESLLKKLEDIDKGIESVSHPFQLFKFGKEDDPWTPEEIESFMSQHSQEQFEPGMKQGVQGDVEVDTVSGDVAEIENYLHFDLNWIISEMPLPKYALGGFEEDVNQFVSRSQESRIEKQIAEARQEIEQEWTPVLEQKAEELGYDSYDVNSLVIGEDPAEINLIEEEKKRQEGDNVPDGNNSNEENVGASGTDYTRPPASTEEDRQEEE